MKISSLICLVVAAAALFMLQSPLFAHHSFAAEFDGNNCRDFTGILTKLDWQSPHPYFFMDIKDASGKVANWSFQTYAPITLRRNGTERQLFIRSEERRVGKESRSGWWAEHYKIREYI